MTLTITLALFGGVIVGVVIGVFTKHAFRLAIIAALIALVCYLAGARLPRFRDLVDDARNALGQVAQPAPIKPGIREAKRWM